MRPFYNYGRLESGFTVAINELEMFCEVEISASEQLASYWRDKTCCVMDVDCDLRDEEVDEGDVDMEKMQLDQQGENSLDKVSPLSHAPPENLNMCTTDQAVVIPGTSHIANFQLLFANIDNYCSQQYVDRFVPTPGIIKSLATKFSDATSPRWKFYRMMVVGFEYCVQRHGFDREAAIKVIANDWIALKGSTGRLRLRRKKHESDHRKLDPIEIEDEHALATGAKRLAISPPE